MTATKRLLFSLKNLTLFHGHFGLFLFFGIRHISIYRIDWLQVYLQDMVLVMSDILGDYMNSAAAKIAQATKRRRRKDGGDRLVKHAAHVF